MKDEPEYDLAAHLSSVICEPLGDDLFKLTLSKANKAVIFEYGLSKLSQSQEEAHSILRNLARWDPDTRSLFVQRSSTTILDTPFRLIYTNDDLPACQETDFYVRQYMAVSYCWRSANFLPDGYERHGDWPVSKPIVDAIISEKPHPRVGIWMDHLCIDQDSSNDKRRSVAAMDIIYRSCLRLLVLLEDVTLNGDEIALSNNKMYDPSEVKFDPTWRPPPEEQVVIESLCQKVSSARWLQRAWCFHEFNVNEPWNESRQSDTRRNATFIMNGPGGSSVKIKWRILHSVLVYAKMNPAAEDLLIPIDFGDRELGWRSSLMARHNAVISKGCLLLEDKLSIVVNMSGLGLAYQGSLGTTDELLYAGTLLALAAGETHPLTMFNGQSLPRLNGNPTWLQRNYLAADLTIPRFKPSDMGGIHRISTQEIELDVVFLQPSAKWTGGPKQDISCTFVIFPETIATTPVVMSGPTDFIHTPQSQTDAHYDEPRRRFLASCMSNGHTFIARLWNQLKEDVVGPNYNQGHCKDLTPNPALFLAAEKLIEQILPVSTLLGISPPPTFTLDDAHLFLTWLTDPRSMLYIGHCTFRIQCTIDGQEAFTTGAELNEHFKNGPYEEVQAAVPMDLLRETCIPLRIWLMRPRKLEDGTEKWTLVGKTRMLGEPDLRQEAERIRRVVVGG